MIDKSRIEESLRLNLGWFENSGVMDPADGRWGVGERVVLSANNKALEQIYREFSSYTEYDGYSVLEHRRPDCNFQVALLYWLAAEALQEDSYEAVTRNILHYLFHRSGLRNNSADGVPPGSWLWANPFREIYWLDDNGWNCAISFFLADLSPALEDEFNLRATALDPSSTPRFCKSFPWRELRAGDLLLALQIYFPDVVKSSFLLLA